MNKTSFVRDLSLSTPLEQCRRLNLLTTNTLSMCQMNGMETVGDLLNYHYTNYHIQPAFNYCNKRIGDELLAFCKRFYHLLAVHDRPQLAPDLDELQLENLRRYMKVVIEDLNLRFQQIFLQTDFRRFYKDYIQGDKSMFFLVGESEYLAKRESEEIRELLRAFAWQARHIPSTFEFDQLAHTCEVHYGCTKEELEPFRNLANQGKFPLFGFISYLIDNGYWLSKDEVFLLESGLGWYMDKPIMPDEQLMKKFNWYISTLKKNLIELRAKIQRKITPLLDHVVYIKRQSDYDFDFELPLFFFTDETVTNLNLEEETTLHAAFYTFITWALFVPESAFLSVKNDKTEHNFSIKKDIAEAFKFSAYFNKYGDYFSSPAMDIQEVVNTTTLHPFFRHLSIKYMAVVKEILIAISSYSTPGPQANSVDENRLVSEGLQNDDEDLRYYHYVKSGVDLEAAYEYPAY